MFFYLKNVPYLKFNFVKKKKIKHDLSAKYLSTVDKTFIQLKFKGCKYYRGVISNNLKLLLTYLYFLSVVYQP